jgi:hypothetical protein
VFDIPAVAHPASGELPSAQGAAPATPPPAPQPAPQPAPAPPAAEPLPGFDEVFGYEGGSGGG